MLLVNMCSAREGGARTIAESFLDHLRVIPSQEIIVFGPDWIKNKNLPNNIILVNKDYSGVMAIFFTTFLMFFYCIRYKADEVISFSNVNIIYPVCHRITYFHQLKLFSGFEFKTFIYNLCIRTQKKTTYIFQSPLVEAMFLDKYKRIERTIVSWPGVNLDYKKVKLPFFEELKRNSPASKFFVVPYYDISSPHKNFSCLFRLQEELRNKNIKVIVTAPYDCEFESDVFFFVGKLSRNELFSLYERVDGMFFPSKIETLGLPIFEFASFGKNIYLGNFDYSRYIIENFSINNIFLVDYDVGGFLSEISCSISEDIDLGFTKSEWSKIFTYGDI